MMTWTSWTVLAIIVVTVQSFPHGSDPKASQADDHFTLVPGFKSANEGSNIPYTQSADGSYSFAFQNSGNSRTESADSNNNVMGKYTYTDADGKTREVYYIAGSETGFVTDGIEAPGGANYQGEPTPLEYAALEEHGTPVDDPLMYGVVVHGPANIPYKLRHDGSYVFAHKNSQGSRQESADSNNNVEGKYTYVVDGKTHEVNYMAGPGIGFLTDIVPGELSNAIRGPTPIEYDALEHGVPAVGSIGFGVKAPANIPFTLRDDGSYIFAHQNSQGSRHESADSNNNVEGKYTYVVDGKTHEVTYIAGAGTGFVTDSVIVPSVSHVVSTHAENIPSPVVYTAANSHSDALKSHQNALDAHALLVAKHTNY